jgi:hypothetical protein
MELFVSSKKPQHKHFVRGNGQKTKKIKRNKKSKLENISKKLVDKSLEKTGCHQKSVRMTLYCSHTVMVGVLPCKAGTI